jgi:mannose-6-phosphate isomerase-like protein (cupin superfamily)
MLIANRLSSPRYKRDHIESFLLVSQLNSKSESISISLVEMQANGIQKPHKHIAEQAYYILNGTGLMQIGNNKRQVTSGDCVLIPSNEEHSLLNIESGPLTYISACSPGFSKKQCKRLWPLAPIEKKLKRNS